MKKENKFYTVPKRLHCVNKEKKEENTLLQKVTLCE